MRSTAPAKVFIVGGGYAVSGAIVAARKRFDPQHVEVLSERFAALAATMRAAIGAAEKPGNAVTADLFTEQSRGLDTGLWFLEAHLQE